MTGHPIRKAYSPSFIAHTHSFLIGHLRQFLSGYVFGVPCIPPYHLSSACSVVTTIEANAQSIISRNKGAFRVSLRVALPRNREGRRKSALVCSLGRRLSLLRPSSPQYHAMDRQNPVLGNATRTNAHRVIPGQMRGQALIIKAVLQEAANGYDKMSIWRR